MSAGTTTEGTLGNLLRQTRLNQELSLRRVAAIADVTPMYLSLLERDECGPPSDEKLIRLSEALGEPHAIDFFARAGRVTPQVVNTILRHPKQWSELIEAAKDLDAAQLTTFKVVLAKGGGKSHTGNFLKSLADMWAAEEGSPRMQESKGKGNYSLTRKNKLPRPKKRAPAVRNAPN